MNNHLYSLSAVLLLTFAQISAAVAAPAPAGEVVIINTGDRLTPGYRVTVQPSGVIASTLVPRGHHLPIRRTDKMIPVIRRRFFSDLAKAKPLQSLPTGSLNAPSMQQRGRSRVATGRVNANPEIFVRYQGHQSPNLRQVNTKPGRVLYQDVKQILSVLRMPIPNVP